jgi:hypothetical protein
MDLHVTGQVRSLKTANDSRDVVVVSLFKLREPLLHHESYANCLAGQALCTLNRALPCDLIDIFPYLLLKS